MGDTITMSELDLIITAAIFFCAGLAWSQWLWPFLWAMITKKTVANIYSACKWSAVDFFTETEVEDWRRMRDELDEIFNKPRKERIEFARRKRKEQEMLLAKERSDE